MTGMFYRNIRARDQLELFLLSAASSLLLVRFYLHITGYPQIGSGGLHIAHMLWGGALMMAALAIGLSFLGGRIQRFVAIIGGVGFGIFIDELGKFITRDNDYFYQPAIGIIYAIFIGLYLTFNFLSRSRPLSSRESQLNALVQLEEAIAHDMDPTEKRRMQQLLDQADATDPLTRRLQKLADSIDTIPPAAPSRLSRLVRWADSLYVRFWLQRNSRLLVQVFFIAEAFVFIGAVAGTLYADINGILELLGGNNSFSLELAVGQLGTSLVAAAFAIWGAILLPRSRMRAYEQFRRATLVNIFLTQFFQFARSEFDALPGFCFNLALLALVSYAIRQEQRLATAN